MRRVLLSLALPCFLLMGCASATTSSGDEDSEKYSQTWTKPYKKTTCTDWLRQMTTKEQTIFVADVLVSVWKRDFGARAGGTLPTDAQTVSMVRLTSKMCDTGVQPLALSAALQVYELDKPDFKP